MSSKESRLLGNKRMHEFSAIFEMVYDKDVS